MILVHRKFHYSPQQEPMHLHHHKYDLDVQGVFGNHICKISLPINITLYDKPQKVWKRKRKGFQGQKYELTGYTFR
jgi:hypothetical protein